MQGKKSQREGEGTNAFGERCLMRKQIMPHWRGTGTEGQRTGGERGTPEEKKIRGVQQMGELYV